MIEIGHVTASTAVFISIVSLLLVLTIASFVSFVGSFTPLERTGTDEDDVVEKADVLEHIMDCGLIYPVLFIYAWVGIYWAVTTQ